MTSVRWDPIFGHYSRSGVIYSRSGDRYSHSGLIHSRIAAAYSHWTDLLSFGGDLFSIEPCLLSFRMVEGHGLCPPGTDWPLLSFKRSLFSVKGLLLSLGIDLLSDSNRLLSFD